MPDKRNSNKKALPRKPAARKDGDQTSYMLNRITNPKLRALIRAESAKRGGLNIAELGVPKGPLTAALEAARAAKAGQSASTAKVSSWVRRIQDGTATAKDMTGKGASGRGLAGGGLVGGLLNKAKKTVRPAPAKAKAASPAKKVTGAPSMNRHNRSERSAAAPTNTKVAVVKGKERTVSTAKPSALTRMRSTGPSRPNVRGGIGKASTYRKPTGKRPAMKRR